MTNALDLVPAFRRQINVYTQGANTNDSALAGYIADAVQALLNLWPDRTYSVAFTSPATYNITPDIAEKDIRPVVLMASIIYKMGNVSVASFTDGDFTWRAISNPVAWMELEKTELLRYVPLRLALPTVGSFYGFDNIYNPESYSWWGVYNYLYL